MESIMDLYLSQTSRSIDDSILKAQFQQKQMQEKEAKLLQMLDNQQQRAIEKANGVLNKLNNNSYNRSTSPHPLLSNPNSNPSSGSLAAGKVRQMFEERRKGGGNVNGTSASSGRTTQGIDKQHPLDPIQLNLAPPSTTKSPSGKSDPGTGAKKNTMAPPIRPSNLGTGTKPVREPSVPTRKESPPKAPTPTRSKVPSERSKVIAVGRRDMMSPERPMSPNPPKYEDLDDLTYPPVARTTKYSDYANELEKREAGLAAKLKSVNLNGHSGESSGSGSSSRSSVMGSPARLKPSSPPKKSVVSALSTSSSTKSNYSAPKPRPSTSTDKKIESKSTVKTKPSGAPPAGCDGCKVCGRFFTSDRIAKHESICKNAAGVKKRKTFDPTKMRMQGTEAESYIRIVTAKFKKSAAANPAAQVKKADWRKKHEEFIATIRAAKEYSAHVAAGGNPNDLPPPPASDNSDYIQCPHCSRKFAQQAAERHIPKCKDFKFNKQRN